MAAETAPALAQRRERNAIPTIYLVALATDTTVQGKGLGGALMADAMMKALEISDTIGAAAIILDVFQDELFSQRMEFYKKIGFAQISPATNPNQLFLSLKDIQSSINRIRPVRPRFERFRLSRPTA